jgi:hypothetical protein
MRSRILLTSWAVAVVLTVTQPCTAAADEDRYGRDFLYGALAITTNVLYMPAKAVYATLGTVTGAFAYLLTAGNSDVAQAVWSPSMGGTYVITPSMLRGEEEFLPSGPSHQRD